MKDGKISPSTVPNYFKPAKLFCDMNDLVLAPYVINIRKYSSEEAYGVIQNWLDRCRSLRRLDFSPNYMIKYNINSAVRSGYLPISLEKLKIENSYLYHVLVNSRVGNNTYNKQKIKK